MADLSRYLPLSRRPDVDESGVTADRRAETAEVLTALAAVVRACDDDAWAAPTARAPCSWPARTRSSRRRARAM